MPTFGKIIKTVEAEQHKNLKDSFYTAILSIPKQSIGVYFSWFTAVKRISYIMWPVAGHVWAMFFVGISELIVFSINQVGK